MPESYCTSEQARYDAEIRRRRVHTSVVFGTGIGEPILEVFRKTRRPEDPPLPMALVLFRVYKSVRGVDRAEIVVVDLEFPTHLHLGSKTELALSLQLQPNGHLGPEDSGIDLDSGQIRALRELVETKSARSLP